MEALHELYCEAFLHAEMPHLPRSGGAAYGQHAPGSRDVDAMWTILQGEPATAEEASLTQGPARFMVEYLGLIEYLFIRLGPGPVRKATAAFVKELEDESLAETAWYLQVLSLFATLTAQKAPWTQPKDLKDMSLQLRVMGVTAGAADGSWTLAQWLSELTQQGFGSAFKLAVQNTLAPKRLLLRRPKWTLTLVSLLRKVWQNILAVPAPKPPTTESTAPQADVLLIILICS